MEKVTGKVDAVMYLSFTGPQKGRSMSKVLELIKADTDDGPQHAGDYVLSMTTHVHAGKDSRSFRAVVNTNWRRFENALQVFHERLGTLVYSGYRPVSKRTVTRRVNASLVELEGG